MDPFTSYVSSEFNADIQTVKADLYAGKIVELTNFSHDLMRFSVMFGGPVRLAPETSLRIGLPPGPVGWGSRCEDSDRVLNEPPISFVHIVHHDGDGGVIYFRDNCNMYERFHPVNQYIADLTTASFSGREVDLCYTEHFSQERAIRVSDQCSLLRPNSIMADKWEGFVGSWAYWDRFRTPLHMWVPITGSLLVWANSRWTSRHQPFLSGIREYRVCHSFPG